MTDFEKEEFWKGLGRLYDSAVALQRATEALQNVANGHEKRLDKLEVITQWLAEKDAGPSSTGRNPRSSG